MLCRLHVLRLLAGGEAEAIPQAHAAAAAAAAEVTLPGEVLAAQTTVTATVSIPWPALSPEQQQRQQPHQYTTAFYAGAGLQDLSDNDLHAGTGGWRRGLQDLSLQGPAGPQPGLHTLQPLQCHAAA